MTISNTGPQAATSSGPGRSLLAQARRDSLRLAMRDLGNDLSNFHLLKYAGSVDGFLVTAKNSGTHWLRFMLSAAIASHLGLPPPARSSGRESDAFICHPRTKARHVHAPRIGSSHNVPSALVGAMARIGLVRLPPTVVLVRDPRQALLSYYVKWREPYGLGELAEFVRRPAPGRRKVEDVWWFIRFFNRWGALASALGSRVLVVRYEDLERDPAAHVRRIWSHWGVTLSNEDVAAALAVSSREALKDRLDPGHGEPIVSDHEARAAVRLTADDEALLASRFGRHLKWPLGYGEGTAEHAGAGRRGRRPPASGRSGWRLLWSALFLVSAVATARTFDMPTALEQALETARRG